MRDFIVSSNITLTTEQLASVFCSALEGGSNSWYFIQARVEPTTWEFTYDTHEEGKAHYLGDYPFNPGGALLISDTIDGEPGETMRIDLDAIQKGLKILAEKYHFHIDNILNENADAETGDAFFQCCLFGDIVYG